MEFCVLCELSFNLKFCEVENERERGRVEWKWRT